MNTSNVRCPLPFIIVSVLKCIRIIYEKEKSINKLMQHKTLRKIAKDYKVDFQINLRVRFSIILIYLICLNLMHYSYLTNVPD